MCLGGFTRLLSLRLRRREGVVVVFVHESCIFRAGNILSRWFHAVVSCLLNIELASR